MKVFYAGNDYDDYGKYKLEDKKTISVNQYHYIDVEYFIDDDGEFVLIDHWIDEGDGDWYVPIDGEFLFQVVE